MKSQTEDNHGQTKDNESRNKNDSSESRDENVPTTQQESPLTLMLEEMPGAQSFYMFLASIFIYIIVYEEIKCFLDTDERRKRNQFFYDQFSSFPLFIKLWLQMHLIMYLIVYPSGKYLASFGFTSFTLTVSVLTSLTCIKYILYMQLEQSRLNGDQLSITLGLALGCESTRLFMKLIAFLIECAKITVRQETSVINFTRFLFYPTLVYKTHWTQHASSGSLKRGMINLFHFIVLVYILGLWFLHIMTPVITELRETVIPGNCIKKILLLKIFFFSSWSALLIYLSIGFSFLHFYMNSAADFTQYSDRIFYKIWWNARSISELMRQWNYLIHSWLQIYIFKPLISVTGIPIAAIIVYVVSGLYHDYVMMVGFGFFCPLFTFFMSIAPISVAINRVIFANKAPSLNMFFRAIGGYIQMGLLISIVILEYEARALCPPSKSTSPWKDKISLRFINCFSFE